MLKDSRAGSVRVIDNVNLSISKNDIFDDLFLKYVYDEILEVSKSYIFLILLMW